MTPSIIRAMRASLLLVIAFCLGCSGEGGFAKPTRHRGRPVPTSVAAKVPWLYENSDIPVDRAWTFGVLPNGVRYAVRRNGVPPHQVAIRVAIDAGSLMEDDSERGYAHFIEHLSFRGSRYAADGEAKRVWQRLGTTFGSDTNAQTTATQTIYKLDLPSADRAGLDESMKLLSGMMAEPSILPEQVDAERRTVMAEAREQNGPQSKVSDATRSLFFAGQKLAVREPIGTTETLTAATSGSLRRFHDRWYRPDKALVVIAGDGDPELFEELIVKYFSDWKATGAPPPDPDFGRPRDTTQRSKVITVPGVPTSVSMATLRPWFRKNDTIVYNQGRLLDVVAIRLINRRLEKRARAGGSFLQAQVDQQDISRSVDGTFVSAVPLGNDWAAALRDVRSVIVEALSAPATQDEINREVGEFVSSLDAEVETQRTQAGSKLADDLVEAVNIRETVASAEVARDVFTAMKDRVNPENILTATKKLFGGVGPRVLLTTPVPIAGGEAGLAAAVAKPVEAAVSLAQSIVSFDRVPKLGKAGAVVSRKPLTGLGMEQIEFANGVRLLLFANPAETGKVYVTARFGNGLKALPTSHATVAWAAGSALIASGIGDLREEEMDRLTSGRRINMGFEVTEDAFQLRAVTRAADLNDQLTLLAAKLERPGWDPSPVVRTRAGALAGFDTQTATPSAVLSRDLAGLLHGGDPRWASPGRAEIEALTPQAFRALWEPLLASGPLELMIFGDVDADAAIAAAAASFGALPPRQLARIDRRANGARGPVPTRAPITRTHDGPPDQTAAVLAWPIAGGFDQIAESRRLDVVAAIFNDRLFEQLREGEGATYSPNVSSNWPTGMKTGGSFVVISQLKPGGEGRFFELSRTIAASLANTPVSDDELKRAVGPMRELVARASSGNTFWMTQLFGASRDPKRIEAINSLIPDLKAITPAALRATAKRWLVPEKAFRMVVQPQPKVAGK
jgi:zinc protease